jgi:hypothetical protein
MEFNKFDAVARAKVWSPDAIGAQLSNAGPSHTCVHYER